MLREILTRHIEFIYPQEDAHALSLKLCAAFGLPPDAQCSENGADKTAPWSQEDSFLITYGDSLCPMTNRLCKTCWIF